MYILLCLLLSLFSELAAGDAYNGFVVTKSIEIPELKAILTELTHETSGLEVVHIGLPDPENFFAITFLAPSDSSKGTAHVLEHCVLEGSKKYPVPNLFHAMTSRTMASFMNAVTTSDTNYYPVSSYNEEDFYNLLDVYLDAVYNPLLLPAMFKQEGHRLEFRDPLNFASPLEYKGVVYNEMKGALSSPFVRLSKAMAAELYRDSAYQFNAGGDPEKILTLTYEELCEFHQKYYYPANTLFFFSGNIPLEKHLDFLVGQGVLDGPKKVRPEVPFQPRYPLNVRKELFYPASSDSPLIGFSWLLGPSKDVRETLAMTILDVILTETDASLLTSRLLQSGLCKEVTASLSKARAVSCYTIIVEGAKFEDADAIEAEIVDTLQEIVQTGISQGVVDRAIERLLLLTSEMGAQGRPFGHTLYQRCVNVKLYGGSVEDALSTHRLIDELRAQGPAIYSELIEKWFLRDPHFVRVTLSPSEELAKYESLQQENALRDIRESLTSDEIEQILFDSEELVKAQEVQNVHLLPKCSLESALNAIQNYELSKESCGALTVYHHDCFTNHITYADLIVSLPEVDPEDLWLLQLFCDLVPELGTATRSYQQNLSYIQEHTAGVSMNLAALHDGELLLRMKTKGLDAKQNELFGLLYDLLMEANCLDRERIKELVVKYAVLAKRSIDSHAFDLALQTSLATVSDAHCLTNSWSGLAAIEKVIDLATHIDERLDDLICKFVGMQKMIEKASRIDLVLTCSDEAMRNAHTIGLSKLGTLEIGSRTACKQTAICQDTACATYVINSQVAFVAQGFMAEPNSAVIAMTAHLLKTVVLHPEIRQAGGAYGGGAKYSLTSGDFTLYSYRDPHIARTVELFQHAFQPLIDGTFSDEALEEARVKAALQYRPALTPGGRAISAYNLLAQGGSSAYIASLTSITRADIQRESALLASKLNARRPVVFAGQELIDKERLLGIFLA